MMSLKLSRKHSGDVSEFKITMGPVSSSFMTILFYKILPVGNILMPHYLNVYHNIKKFWKQETNIHTRGDAILPANGRSDHCTAPCVAYRDGEPNWASRTAKLFGIFQIFTFIAYRGGLSSPPPRIEYGKNRIVEIEKHENGLIAVREDPMAKGFVVREANRESGLPNSVTVRDKIFDRPSRYVKAMQIKIFTKTIPNSFVWSLPQTTKHSHSRSTETHLNQPSNPLESPWKLSFWILEAIEAQGRC
ncbi:hypothetical protein E3N88_25479 [Mikania micrantha]|uniref:Uncharacterized protein n=1 Tax=Mikania micrantha TaxID=192012 RepID=A0A5N6N7N2_9ASTR|nr:hypothetical protein E3N88_25479 [Mikania micrantha]